MKSVYKMVLFDLDGTLTKSGPGIIGSVIQTLNRMKLPVPPEATLRRFIGPPLSQSFARYCGLSAEESEHAVAVYREFYHSEGIFNNSLYPHAMELLQALRASGAKVCMATSKPQSQADRVAALFHLDSVMDMVSGAAEDERSSSKAELIRKCLTRFGIEPRRAVMVGDTLYDARGAKGAGTDFIGVLYGYGSQDEMLAEFPAARFASGFPDLERMLLTK